MITAYKHYTPFHGMGYIAGWVQIFVSSMKLKIFQPGSLGHGQFHSMHMFSNHTHTLNGICNVELFCKDFNKISSQQELLTIWCRILGIFKVCIMHVSQLNLLLSVLLTLEDSDGCFSAL